MQFLIPAVAFDLDVVVVGVEFVAYYLLTLEVGYFVIELIYGSD